MAKSDKSTSKPSGNKAPTDAPSKSGEITIQDRIAEAMTSMKKVDNPIDGASETVPEGMVLMGKKAPMAARHLACLYYELKQTHMVVARAHFMTEPGSEEDAAEAAHSQNHADTDAVHAALNETLQKAYPDKNDEFSDYFILKNWEVARQHKSESDNGMPAGLDDFLKKFGAGGMMDEARQRFGGSGSSNDPLGLGERMGARVFTDMMRNKMSGNMPGGMDNMFTGMFGGEGFSNTEEGDPDNVEADSDDILKILKRHARQKRSESMEDKLETIDEIVDFFRKAYGKGGRLTSRIEIGDGEITFKTTIRL